jgi:uncharacterized protein (DUF305 family)
VAVALVVVVLVAVLGDDGSAPGDDSAVRVVQPSAPGERASELTEDDLEEIDQPTYSAADVGFMQGMIVHHQQALEMTALVPDRSQSREIALLARRIELSQKAEIAQMKDWLTARDERVSAGHGGHAHHSTHGGWVHDHSGGSHEAVMPGMLTEGQLARLAAARDDEFDRLFLEGMIQHHRGALVMVDELRADGGAVETESYTISAHVEADQEIEIGRMRDVLSGRF